MSVEWDEMKERKMKITEENHNFMLKKQFFFIQHQHQHMMNYWKTFEKLKEVQLREKVLYLSFLCRALKIYELRLATLSAMIRMKNSFLQWRYCCKSTEKKVDQKYEFDADTVILHFLSTMTCNDDDYD